MPQPEGDFLATQLIVPAQADGQFSPDLAKLIVPR